MVRVRDPLHEDGFQKACAKQPSEGVCVNPDTASVDRIAALLEVPGAVDVMQFFGGGMLVATSMPPPKNCMTSTAPGTSSRAAIRSTEAVSGFTHTPSEGCLAHAFWKPSSWSGSRTRTTTCGVLKT